MGADSKIQWTDFTFNPWIGCEKVSDGCKHCYAEVHTYARVSKAHGLPLWGKGAHRHVTSADNWRAPLRWNREAEAAGERRRVFCASLADVFEARDALDEHRTRLWNLIGHTPSLDWLLLTKRPEQIMHRIPTRWRPGLPMNVWVGCTVEDQKSADERIPHLLKVPARVRFLSCEPLLERIDITMALEDFQPLNPDLTRKPPPVSWVIVGGESGPRARPCALEWIEHLIGQCRAAGSACFTKQLGALLVSEERALDESLKRVEGAS